MSLNRVILTGNLTHDPELRSLPTGTFVLVLRLAVNERRKNSASGEWEEVPNYFDCNVFGSRAESLNKYLSKGSKVGIDGRLRWSSWEKDGQKRSKVDIVVDNLEFLSSRNNEGGGYAASGSGYQASGSGYQAPAPSSAPSADQIPAMITFEEEVHG